MTVLEYLALNGSEFRTLGEELVRMEVIGDAAESKNDARVLFKIDPISPDQEPFYTYTNGMYSIVYTNFFYKWERKERRFHPETPFKLHCDLLRENFRMTGPKNFERLCEKIPEYKFIKEKTTFNKKIFEIAKKHPNMHIYFNPKWDEIETEKIGLFDNRGFTEYLTSKKHSDFSYKDNDIMIQEDPELKREYDNNMKEHEKYLKLEKEILERCKTGQ